MDITIRVKTSDEVRTFCHIRAETPEEAFEALMAEAYEKRIAVGDGEAMTKLADFFREAANYKIVRMDGAWKPVTVR